MEEKTEITCPACHLTFAVSKESSGYEHKFCIFCGASLQPSALKSQQDQTMVSQGTFPSSGSVTLVPGHIPQEEPIQFTIGPYQVLRSIGKGGMGEVFLAYDTTCGRRIALKRIRADLMEHIQMHNRFLKEARITSQLTHPAIIPIYTIHGENKLVYYTMPFVEGKTLKQILRDARHDEKTGEKTAAGTSSIPALIRVFISICQAVAYAHSKKVLHRDLKPENIIVGQYGEVLILDWGLAKMMKHASHQVEESYIEVHHEHESHPLHQLTHLGKVVGTVAYMAPERALGQPANFQTDIYSLGVILYQILTLHLPFKRGTLKEFRQHMHEEKLYDPIEVAPYRDVPRLLSRTVLKCLSPAPENRYNAVDDLIHDLENYIEGRSEWFPAAELKISEKSHWQFQENVLIAEHIAITRGTEVSDWVSLMISKDSFPENIKLEAKVRIGEKGHGIGFLLSIPEASERVHLNDGYCLWLGSDLNKSTKLLRSTVEVMHNPEIYLQRHEWFRVCIEKIDTNIHFYLNDLLQFSYISHLPLVGTHVGLLSRDADFSIQDFTVYVGNQNITVNCLAVPDAFLAHKDYATALSEYRRIGYSFPGRAEGREAMFRAGITLLEQGRNSPPAERGKFYDMALEEFQKLHGKSGAPLEYLGKALVYQAQRDYEEEIKCYELAYRRYPKHPLLPVLEEQIVYRMHDSSRYHRKATYNFMLLAVRHLPKISSSSTAKRLFNSLQKHWEPLPFIEDDPSCLESDAMKNLGFGTQLAFWLAKPYVLAEIFDDLFVMEPLPYITLCNVLFCLIELGSWELAQEKKNALKPKADEPGQEELRKRLEMVRIALLCHKESLEAAQNAFSASIGKTLPLYEERTALYLMNQALLARKFKVVYLISSILEGCDLSAETKLYVDCLVIKAYMLENNWQRAGEILYSYPLEMLSKDTTPLHYLHGCWLNVTEGKELSNIHFSGVFEVSYPRSWTLLSHYLNGRISEGQIWFDKAFLWEKRQLYHQLALFYHCSGDSDKAEQYHKLEMQEVVHARE